MQFKGAVIREQGVTFAVVLVNRDGLLPGRREIVQEEATRLFGGLPVVVAGSAGGGRVSYWGRRDIAGFMARVPVEAVPWKVYATTAT
jgi:hypothetical protein